MQVLVPHSLCRPQPTAARTNVTQVHGMRQHYCFILMVSHSLRWFHFTEVSLRIPLRSMLIVNSTLHFTYLSVLFYNVSGATQNKFHKTTTRTNSMKKLRPLLLYIFSTHLSIKFPDFNSQSYSSCLPYRWVSWQPQHRRLMVEDQSHLGCNKTG